MAAKPTPTKNALGVPRNKLNNATGVSLYGRRTTGMGMEPESGSLTSPDRVGPNNPMAMVAGMMQPKSDTTMSENDMATNPVWGLTPEQWKKAKLKAGLKE